MEWNEVIYEMFGTERYIQRIREMIFVLCFSCLVIFGVSEADRSAAAAAVDGENSMETVTGVFSAGEFSLADAADNYGKEWTAEFVNPEKTGGDSMSAVLPAAQEAADTAFSTGSKDQAGFTDKPDRIMQETAAPLETAESGMQTEPVLPMEPAADETQPDASAPVMPIEDISEDMNETYPSEVMTAGGFLVDENGMICGIYDPSAIVSDEYLELPSSGCCGIAAGAFLSAPSGIREVYIPENITYMEEGAFSGLTQVEWFEKEASGGFYSEDGVLFSDEGSCLFCFPAGRVGTYRVPSQVTRFAVDAFNGSKLDAVDVVETSLADTGNMPESIRLVTSSESVS